MIGAIDIGGKSIKTGFVNRNGLVKALDPYLLPLVPNPDVFFRILGEAVRGLLETAKHEGVVLEAVGVGVPGLVEPESGNAYLSINLQWAATNFKTLIEQQVNLPVYIQHDVKCGAIAEIAFGALRDMDDFLYVAIGTGLGAAIGIGGQFYCGSNGFAGELGHAIVYPDGRQCDCGRRGCLETYCSAKHIERQYQEITGIYHTCREIAQLSVDGEAAATQVWESAITALAIALVNYHTVFCPKKVVIGGGVSASGENVLLNPLKSKLQSMRTTVELPEIVLSTLGPHSGLIGAGYQVYLRRGKEVAS